MLCATAPGPPTPQRDSGARGGIRLLALDDPRHGTAAGYWAGCRCDPCREARREYDRARRERGLEPDDPRHGTINGYWFGCRCDLCREAHNEYNRARREQGLKPNDPRHGTYAGYARGCRCDPCREAKREYDRIRSKQGLESDDPRHGTRGGYSQGCRCDPCKKAVRKYRREQRYGLTDWDVDLRLVYQDGRCAICQNKITKGNLNVDHCHDTGRIRGLLCRACNMSLGGLGDDAVGIRRAYEYLRDFEDSC